MPPSDKPGGGLAGDTVEAFLSPFWGAGDAPTFLSAPASASAPNDPKPKSRFCESPASPESQCPIFNTLVGAAGGAGGGIDLGSDATATDSSTGGGTFSGIAGGAEGISTETATDSGLEDAALPQAPPSVTFVGSPLFKVGSRTAWVGTGSDSCTTSGAIGAGAGGATGAGGGLGFSA